MSFYNEPGFWTAVATAFSFLTAVVASIRWLLRVLYIYRQKNLLIKARLESSIEKLKSENIALAIEGLKKTIGHIEPIVQIHEVKMGTLEVSLKNIESLERNLAFLTDELKIGYKNFNIIVPKITASGQLLLDRVQKMETEIINFKNGDFMVRTKK